MQTLQVHTYKACLIVYTQMHYVRTTVNTILNQTNRLRQKNNNDRLVSHHNISENLTRM